MSNCFAPYSLKYKSESSNNEDGSLNNENFINSSSINEDGSLNNENFINFRSRRESFNEDTSIYMKNKSTDNINISSTQSNTNNEMNNTIFDSKNGNSTNDNRISAEFGTKGNNLIGKKKEIIFKIKKNVREDNLIYRFKIQFYQNFIISIANKIIGIKENIEEQFLKISKNVN